MLFNLTNAPTTLQVQVNQVFCGQLRQFIFIFFHDILMCSKAWNRHKVLKCELWDSRATCSIYKIIMSKAYPI